MEQVYPSKKIFRFTHFAACKAIFCILIITGFSFSHVPAGKQPINLVSFTAQLNEKKVTLNWVTSMEDNSSHFVIQRSSDGKSYDDQGFVFTDEVRSGSKLYIYSDDISNLEAGSAKNAGNTPVYYRLKLVDPYGANKFSDIVVVDFLKEKLHLAASRAYPNPASNELRVSIPAAWQNKLVSYNIYNSNGRLVMQQVIDHAALVQSLKISSLPVGMYLVRVETGSQTVAQSFIKVQ